MRREDIVKEARSWIGTPYQLNQCTKGEDGAVDCGRLIYAVMLNCGLVTPEAQQEVFEIFGPNWHAGVDEEKYKKYIYLMLRHHRRILEGFTNHALAVKPGMIALMHRRSDDGRIRVGDHGGIITKWPHLVHAIPGGVKEVNASNHWLWDHTKVEIFDAVGVEE